MKAFILACFVFCVGCGDDRWIEVTVIRENRQVHYQTDSGVCDEFFTHTLVEDAQRRRHRCRGRWGDPGDKFFVNRDARYFWD